MRQISEKGTATYTEIMQVLGLDPSLMSGKFNYHLKELTEAGLIERLNGDYMITDLGKKALILVDQVGRDVKIDQYGVLSAVMSMSPKRELDLFLYQMGTVFGLFVGVFSLVAAVLTYGVSWTLFWPSVALGLAALVIALRSTWKMVGIIRKMKLGLSSLVFLQLNWFLIRSPNRNGFLIITFFAIGSFVNGFLFLLLSYSGELALYSLQWVGMLLGTIFTTLLTIALTARVRSRTLQLEAAGIE